MSDPYAILGVPEDATDEVIRQRYIALVREFPPDRHPARFDQIRQAYEALRDVEARLRRLLFEAGQQDSIESIVEELTCRMPRSRPTLQQLLDSLDP